MTLIMPDEGETLALKYLVNFSAPTDLKLHLFKNDIDPDDDTVLSDLIEVDESGYSPVVLTGASWSIANVGGVTTASYASQIFTITESVDVFGYHITDNADTKIIVVERFPGGPYIITGSGPITIAPKISAD